MGREDDGMVMNMIRKEPRSDSATHSARCLGSAISVQKVELQ